VRYFVTGATGFIGGRLARDPSKASEMAAMGAQVVRGDIIDREGMRAPMAGADGVFHVAG